MADLISERLAELLSPLAHGLVGHANPAGRQHFLDHAQAQGKPEVEPNRITDDFRRKAMAAIEGFTSARHGSAYATIRSRSVKLTVPCEVAFEVGSFHAVGAFYSITHIPRTQQGPLIAKIASWLKPGGMFVASFGSGAAGEWTGEWLGTTMFFGHNGEAETLRCLADSGLRVRDSSVEKQDNEEAAFMWIEAVKDRYPPDRHVHRRDQR